MAGLKFETWKRLTETPLFLEQTDAQIEFNREDIESAYLPLARMLLRKSQAIPRLMVAIAGPPGSGKTIFSILLVSVINTLQETRVAAYIGLDGWHYPNDYLETHLIEIDGKPTKLRLLKGTPETFDSGAAFDCLQAIRRGSGISFPIYSRELHDPIPGAGIILPTHRIVIVEGNYLLLDAPPWNKFFDLFDLHIFLDASAESLLGGLRERHIIGGKSPEFTEEHMRRVDLPNIELVKPGIQRAEVIVHKADSRRIVSIDGLN